MADVDAEKRKYLASAGRECAELCRKCGISEQEDQVVLDVSEAVMKAAHEVAGKYFVEGRITFDRILLVMNAGVAAALQISEAATGVHHALVEKYYSPSSSREV